MALLNLAQSQFLLCFLMASPGQSFGFKCCMNTRVFENFFLSKYNLLWLIIFPVYFPGTSYSAMLRLSRVEQSHRYLDITSELQGHFPWWVSTVVARGPLSDFPYVRTSTPVSRLEHTTTLPLKQKKPNSSGAKNAMKKRYNTCKIIIWKPNQNCRIGFQA